MYTFNPDASAEELRAQVQALIDDRHREWSNGFESGVTRGRRLEREEYAAERKVLADRYLADRKAWQAERKALEDNPPYFQCRACLGMVVWTDVAWANSYDDAESSHRLCVMLCDDCLCDCHWDNNYEGCSMHLFLPENCCYSCSKEGRTRLMWSEDLSKPMRVCFDYPSCTLLKFRRAVTKLRHVWRWYKAALLSQANRIEEARIEDSKKGIIHDEPMAKISRIM